MIVRQRPVCRAATKLMSAEIAVWGGCERSGQKSRLLPAVDEVTSAEIAVWGWLRAQRAKVTPFARGRRSNVRRNRFLRFRPI